MRSPARSGRLASVAFLLVLSGWLLVHCRVTSAVKPMWMDEMLAYTLVINPSPSRMLDTLAHGADGGFPLYYLIGWSVARTVSPTEWHLRLVSSVLEASALALWFGLLRRTYGTLPAMLATTVGVGGSTLLLYQNSELRFYTLLLLGAVVTLRAYDRLFRRALGGSNPSAGALALNAAGHALLVLTHPFGIVYSFVISLSAVAAFWWLRPRRFLPGYLISCACGDATFLCWLGKFIEQSRVAANHTVLPVPSVADFFRIYLQVAPMVYYEDRTKAWVTRMFLPVSHHLAAVTLTATAACLAVIVAVILARRLLGPASAPVELENRPPTDAHLRIVAAAFILVPAVVWVTSHLGKSLFIHRYFIPSALGFTVFYARAFAQLGRRATRHGVWNAWRRDHPRATAALAAAAGLWFVGIYGAWPLAAAWTAPDGYAVDREQIARVPPGGIPVVCITGNEFWELSHYATPNPYWFVLDREVAFAPDNGLPAISEFTLGTAFLHAYPTLHLARSEDFLTRFPRFIVERARDNPWYARRVRGNPAYTSAPVPGMMPGTVLITKKAPSSETR